jgi:hypothetical protein
MINLVQICRARTNFFHITQDRRLSVDIEVNLLITMNAHMPFVSQSETV